MLLFINIHSIVRFVAVYLLYCADIAINRYCHTDGAVYPKQVCLFVFSQINLRTVSLNVLLYLLPQQIDNDVDASLYDYLFGVICIYIFILSSLFSEEFLPVRIDNDQ